MTSNMIHIVALGVGFKCPHKIHLNTQWGGEQKYPKIQISVDHSTLFQPAGADYAHHNTTPPSPPVFQTFPRPCNGVRAICDGK